LAFHSHSAEEVAEMKQKLFLPDYEVEPITEMLLDRLDCGLADVVISKMLQTGERARRFAKTDLDIVVSGDAKKIKDDHVSNVSVKCGCNTSNWRG